MQKTVQGRDLAMREPCSKAALSEDPSRMLVFPGSAKADTKREREREY